jgi:hypothetical protein
MRVYLVPLLLLVACSGSAGEAPVSRATPAGTFLYTALGSGGKPLLQGEIELQVGDDSTLTGSWNIHWAPGADTTTTVGPQVGTGTLNGSFRDTLLVIQLNPNMADNNVSLLAARGTAGYTGRWEYSTIAGPTAGGGFEAVWSDSLPASRAN